MAPGLTVLLLFLAPALLVLATFRLAPVVVAVVGSFYSQNLMGELSFAGLRNYISIFSDESFWASVKTTLLFNAVINPLQVFLAFCLALMTFQPGRGISLYRTALFLPMTFSTSLAAVLWQLLLDGNMGPVNAVLRGLGFATQPFYISEDTALWTMIGVACWKSAGYWMIFMLTGLYRIPSELYEAAHLDGAGWWQRLFYITLPQMRRTIVFVLVSDTAINFLFFAPVYIITKGGPNGATDLLMYGTYETAFIYSNWGKAFAMSTVLLGIIGLIAAIELRFLREKEGA